MSAVETSDHVSNEHFLGASLALDSVGTQLAELCPCCVPSAGAGTSSERAAAAPFVAVLVGSSEVRNGSKTTHAFSVSFRLSPWRVRTRARVRSRNQPPGLRFLVEAVESALKRMATRSAEGRCTRASAKLAKGTQW